MILFVMYVLGLVLTFSAGWAFIRWLCPGRIPPLLHLALAGACGLGMDGLAAFCTHVLLNQAAPVFPVAIVVLVTAALGAVIFSRRSAPQNSLEGSFQLTLGHKLWLLATVCVLALPLSVSAWHFPLGGWDAWSCWNLKAKFIYLGGEHWKDVLAPGFWRSNTHYPLLWPLVNVWFFDLCGRFDQAVPMLNSLLVALLIFGVLVFGLIELTCRFWPSLAAAVLALAAPVNVTLYTSQYSDSVMGLLLLSAFTCFFLGEKYTNGRMKVLGVLLLGLMSFTKNEGLVAAGICALVIFWHERSRKPQLKALILAFFLALVPTMVFTLFIAPRNEAFVNGLLSTAKPTTLSRLEVILVYPFFEMISAKWNGFWLLVAASIALGRMKLWRSALGVAGLSLVLYAGAVAGYYAVNTFFEIGWWLSTTLSRLLFTVIPTVILWITAGLVEENK